MKRQRFWNSDIGSRSSDLGEQPAFSGTEISRDAAVIPQCWAIDRLVQGERPAIALLLYSCCASWAVDQLVLRERPATVLPKLLLSWLLEVDRPYYANDRLWIWSLSSFFLQKASFFVFLCLDFCASSQITCTFTKLIKTDKTWGFYNNSIWKIWYMSEYIAHSSPVHWTVSVVFCITNICYKIK